MEDNKPTNHLAVYRRIKEKNYIDWMLKGTKTIDIKFSYHRIAPYGYIKPGDYMFIKEAGGPVVGRCTLGTVKFVDTDSDKFEMLDILLEVWKELGLRDEEHAKTMFEKVKEKRYMTVFSLEDQIELQRPVKIEKNDRRVWVANYDLPLDLKFEFGMELGDNGLLREIKDEGTGTEFSSNNDSDFEFKLK